MKISTRVHVRGWAIYDLGKRFNIAIHLLNLQCRYFILNIRIRKFKLYLSVRHPVLKSLSGDWTDVIINTLCYNFWFYSSLRDRWVSVGKTVSLTAWGQGNVLVFPSFSFASCLITMDLILLSLSLRLLLHKFHFQVVEEFVFGNTSRLFLLCWVKLFIAWQLVSVKKLIFSELVRSSFEGVRSLRHW